MSVSGSSLISVASGRRPSASTTSILSAPWTTWLFVRASPSRLIKKPEPEPACREVELARLCVIICSTEGLAASAALTTAAEYASNSAGSLDGAWVEYADSASFAETKSGSTAARLPKSERDITTTFRKTRRNRELYPSRIAPKMYLDRSKVNTLTAGGHRLW